MFETILLSVAFFIGGLFTTTLTEPSSKITLKVIGKSILFVFGVWVSLCVCVFGYCLIRGLVALIIGG